MGECKNLDNKHSVFGEVIGGIPLIHKFNGWETNSLDKPKPDIKITEIIVLENPFRETIKQLKEEEEEKNKKEINGKKDKHEEFWIQKNGEGFRLPEAKKNKVQTENDFSLIKFLIDSNQLNERASTKEEKKLNKLV